MDADAAARHSSGLLAILSVAPPRLMNGASHAPLTNREDWTREKHKPNPHVPYEQAGLVERGVLVTRAELLKFLPFGLAATHRSRTAKIRREKSSFRTRTYRMSRQGWLDGAYA